MSIDETWTEQKNFYFVLESGTDLVNRTIYFTEEVDEESYGDFLVGFKTLDSGDGPIKLVLNTPGGDLVSMFSMYDLITTAKNDIIGIGTGEIASAGVLILACCDRRYVTENAVLMSHQHSIDSGNLRYDEAKARRRLEDWWNDQWAELLARHTPRDKAYWKRITNKEAEMWLLGGDEIVEAGLADGVIKGKLNEFLASHT